LVRLLALADEPGAGREVVAALVGRGSARGGAGGGCFADLAPAGGRPRGGGMDPPPDRRPVRGPALASAARDADPLVAEAASARPAA
jgi:hypothetical protein